MRTIGVRELKAHLSRTLHDVQRGEHYLVTDRGRVVAELRLPGADLPASLSKQEQGLLRMVAAGQLRLAEQPKLPLRKTGVRLPDGTAQELLDWVRGER